MAVPSTKDIQEQLQQQQLVGMNPALQQQSYPPMSSPEKYMPYIPPNPYVPPGLISQANLRGTSVNVSKISLLGMSFSLMLLGAFTFLGGFFLGIWVARPQWIQPIGGYTSPPQNVYYAAPQTSYPQHQGTPARNELASDIGDTAKTSITSAPLQHEQIIASPLVRAAQEELGRQVGQGTETLVREGQRELPSYSSTQIAPMPTPAVNSYATEPVPSAPQPASPVNHYLPQAEPHTQVAPAPPPPVSPSAAPQIAPPTTPTPLPVITPQSGLNSAPIVEAMSHSSQATDEVYTVQLGEYASLENANALVNHMQALNYASQITEGKAVDGSKIYYVHSGFYKDYTTAHQVASQFVKYNIPGVIIVKISQLNTNAP